MSKGVGVHPARCWSQVRSSRRGEQPARLGQGRVKVDRAEVPDVDTYIDLTGQRSQTAMAMAVQVECATVLTVPGTQGIMAENEAASPELELGIVLNAGPAGEGPDRRWIIVAGDEVLGAVQARQKSGSASRGDTNREIAQMPDRIARCHRGVPALHQRRVHGGDGWEWSAEQAQRTAMALSLIHI